MNLLWHGGNPGVIGGQSRVSFFTIQELIRLGVNVTAVGKGTQVLPPGIQSPCPAYEYSEHDPIEKLHSVIDHVKPDVILFSHDCWLFYYAPALKAKYPHVKFVGWFTIDAHPLHSSWCPIMRAMDHIITPTRFGKDVIYAKWPERTVEVVPYGIDHEVYNWPEGEDKQEYSRQLKQKFSQDNNIPYTEDYCLFTFTGANQFKKNLGVMVDAFIQMNDPQARLLLLPKSGACQIGTYQFFGEYELHEFAHHPNIIVAHNSFLDDAALAELYRMSDFFLYPSQGEAPGLQIGESQLCGCIPICTNYTGMPEESCFEEFLINDFILQRGQFGCYRAVVGADALMKRMGEAVDFWRGIQTGQTGCENPYVRRYNEFLQESKSKFVERSWQNSAKRIQEICQSLTGGGLLVDLELKRL